VKESLVEMERREEISQIVMAAMQAMRLQDEEKEKRRGRASQITKCLRAVINQLGEFDGNNVTKYMRGYWKEVKLHDLDEETAILKFPTLVEPEIKKVVDKLVKEETSWEAFMQKMKEEFLLQDADRVTQATFLDWVNERNKGLGPQELLKEFNKRFHQMTTSEVEMIKLQRASYFLRSADSRLRDELEYALDILHPQRFGKATWEQIENAVLWVSQRRRQRELDDEAIARTPIRSSETSVAKERKEINTSATEKKENSIDDLSKLMEGLRILTTQVLEQQSNRRQDGDRGSSNKGNIYGCMWCDSKDHGKRDCQELSVALRSQWVKFVGEPGMKKIAFYDTGEPVPLNNNKGGMKALVEKHIKEREVKMAAAVFEPNVFTHALSDGKNKNSLDEADKRRLAEHIRRKSGWDAPVLITSITAEVGAAWEAMVDDKRKADGLSEEGVQSKEKQRRIEPEKRITRRKDVRFEEKDPMIVDPSPSSVTKNHEASSPSIMKKKEDEKATKKGPGWLLSREVEMERDPYEVATKFWKQEARGFTNEEFFGSLRKDVQEIILSKAKKKRFYKEGPNLLHFSRDDEEDMGEELMSYQVNVHGEGQCKQEVDQEENVASFEVTSEKVTSKIEETQELYWARGCSECEIEMEGVQGPIRALIDSGSEVNLMAKTVYDEGQWMVDRDIQWKVNSVNSTKNVLWGACPDVKIKIGNVIEPVNIFVHDNLPYPVILGQPFITQLRLETKVLDDGTHMAKVKSRNGLRIVQFPTVRPGNGRNKRELRDPEKRGGWDFQ
jgi:Protein of unknown function (DUF4100)